MQNHKYIRYIEGLVIFAIVFLLGVSVGRDYQAPTTETVSKNQSLVTASLMIDYSDSRVKTYPDLSGTSAFDVLKNAADANGVELKYKDYGAILEHLLNPSAVSAKIHRERNGGNTG